jgi:hypothetical protein
MQNDRLNWRIFGYDLSQDGITWSHAQGLSMLKSAGLHIDSIRDLYGFMLGVHWIGVLSEYEPATTETAQMAAIAEAMELIDDAVVDVLEALVPLIPVIGLIQGVTPCPGRDHNFVTYWPRLSTIIGMAYEYHEGCPPVELEGLTSRRKAIACLLGDPSPETLSDVFCIIQGLRQVASHAIDKNQLVLKSPESNAVGGLMLMAVRDFLNYLPESGS